jgi:CRP/FNR family cyclic AMP-dependent transcriptional regulator
MPDTDQMLLIRRHDFFAQLSNDDYESLDILHNFKEARRNEYIYFEAQQHRNLYFVKDGFVKIGYHDRDGNEVVKEIIGSGDIFGQITLEEKNGDGEFAQAYKADVSLCMFRVEEFSRLLERKPQLAIRFTQQVGNKLNRLECRMINLLQKDIRSRLLYFFFTLTQQYKPHVKDNTFKIPNFLTHDDVARLIGSSRQTVTTMLTMLEQEGLVAFSRQFIQVTDVKKIQAQLNV